MRLLGGPPGAGARPKTSTVKPQRALIRLSSLEKSCRFIFVRSLALHVRAHEGAVGVVVLEERDQGSRHGDDLLGAHVHVLDLVRTSLRELVAEARDTVRIP